MSSKPILPESFSAPSTLATLLFSTYTLAMFFLPSALACYLVLSVWPGNSLVFILCLPLLLVSGQGMHLMGWMGHEGLHFSFHRNRMVSAVIGVFFSAGTVTFLEMGMALDHWTHHRYTNREEDPDLRMFEALRSFWPRMLFTRLRSNRHYLRRVWALVLRRPLPLELRRIILPFKLETIRRLALFNVFCNLLWAALYATIAWFSWKAFLLVYLIPMVFANFLSGLRPYVEHNGTGQEDLDNTRSRTSLLWTILDLGGNYHAEHHLYPSVPQWRLPALHRYLKDHDFLPRNRDASALAHYRFATGAYQYPSAADRPGVSTGPSARPAQDSVFQPAAGA